MADWIDRETLIKALEADFNTDWADYARKSNFDKDYIDGVRDEYDDALTIICQQKVADTQPVDRWISIYNRLPEENESVLIYTSTGARSVATRFGNRFFVGLTASFVKEDVTHWQPLPEPPKED